MNIPNNRAINNTFSISSVTPDTRQDNYSAHKLGHVANRRRPPASAPPQFIVQCAVAELRQSGCGIDQTPAARRSIKMGRDGDVTAALEA